MKLLLIVVLIILLVVYLETKIHSVDRVSYKYTSKNDFEKRTTPCIITGATNDWIAHSSWSFENLIRTHGNANFMLADGGEMIKLIDYIQYCDETNDDEPLYIFDESYSTRSDTKSLTNDYTTPSWFLEDVFKNLGKLKPPHNWFIMGPRGSGSDLHVDPLGTSAWNALVKGKKEWVIFEPNAAVQQSLKSGAAWLRDEYPKFKHLKHYRVIQNPCEILYIPPGWWHIAINHELSIAVTQNYLHPSHLEQAKEIIQRERPDIYQIIF